MPSRELIDDVTPNHPVLVHRFDRSMFLANSLALKLAGVTDATPEPATARFVSDADGRLTGILKGSAVDLVRKAMPPISFDQRLVQVRAVLQEAREGGVTTMQDLTSAEQLRAYQELQPRGELTSRIMLRPTLDNVTHTAGSASPAASATTGSSSSATRRGSTGSWAAAARCSSSRTSNDPKNKGLLRES